VINAARVLKPRAESFEDARGERNDVLQGAAQLHTNHVGVRIHAEVPASKTAAAPARPPRDPPPQRRPLSAALIDFERERRTREHRDRRAGGSTSINTAEGRFQLVGIQPLGRADDQRGGRIGDRPRHLGHDRAHGMRGRCRNDHLRPPHHGRDVPRRGECGGEKRSRQKHLVHVPLIHALDDFGRGPEVTCSLCGRERESAARERDVSAGERFFAPTLAAARDIATVVRGRR